MDNVILHSAEDPVTRFCENLTQALGQKQIAATSLKIESHENSVAVAQKLDIKQGCFLLIVLDNTFIEILEHKKSRKLFTKISGYIAAKNTIFINHSVSEETWTELKDDLDHPNPILITCEDCLVTDLADRITVLTVPVPKEATESADEPGGSTCSLGEKRLNASQWLSLNPRSISQDPLLNVRGQPEGNSQSEETISSEETEAESESNVSSGSSQYATCMPDTEERLSSQLAVSGQDLVNPQDDISRHKAEILSQEERMACSAGDTCIAADVQGKDATKSSEGKSYEKDDKADPNNALGLSHSPPNEPSVGNNQAGNIPNFSVLCAEQSYNNSVGPHFIQSVYGNSVALSGIPVGHPQNQVYPPNLIFPSSVLTSSLFANSDSRVIQQMGHVDPATSDVTSYVHQDFQSHSPWGPGLSSVRQIPGTCPICGRYRDNILFFPGLPGSQNSHMCSSFTSRSGPEAMSNMYVSTRICNDCFILNRQQMRGYPQQLPGDLRYMQRNNARSEPGLDYVCHQPQMSQPNMPSNQLHSKTVPAAENKALNTQSYEGVQGQLPHSLPRQPYSAPVLSPFQPRNFNNVNNAVSFRPEIKRLEEQMRHVQVQPYNIPAYVHNSGSTNSDNNTQSGDSSTKSCKTCQSTQTDRKENLKPGLMPQTPSHRPQFPDEVGPSVGSGPSNYPPDAGGASAADSYGDIILMDLSHEVMLYIQNNMDYNDSSLYNWEKLATLHGWSFGQILQLRQRWHKRQVDSPFLELMGREEFQNYTLRQLREDLTKIPRKDILEKLRVFEERGLLTPSKYSK